MAQEQDNDSCDLPETATANEDLIDLIQQWKQDNSKRDIVMVVAGKSGTGKSTLINNFLTLDKKKAAESRLQPTSVTKDVKRYEGEVNGVPIRAVDMPGLHARKHSVDTESDVIAGLSYNTNGQADILIYCVSLTQRLDLIDERNIATLNKAFGKKIWQNAIFVLTHADSVLEDEDNASNFDEVVEAFTKELQEILAESEVKACIKPFSSGHASESSISEGAVAELEAQPSVSTQGEKTKMDTSDSTSHKESGNETSGSEAKIDTEKVAVPCGVDTQPTSSVQGPETKVVPDSSTATDLEREHSEETSDPAKAPDTESTGEENEEIRVEIVVIPTGKKPNKPSGWRESLLAQIITVIQSRAFSKLTQLEGISWEKIIKKLKKGAKVGAAAGAIGAASGATVGAGIGSAIGAFIGGVLTAPIGGVGAAPTAAGGAAVGALIGTLFGGGGVGIIAVLAGGITSAHNQNLFKDIAFYSGVHKKLEELQKKGQDKSD